MGITLPWSNRLRPGCARYSAKPPSRVTPSGVVVGAQVVVARRCTARQCPQPMFGRDKDLLPDCQGRARRRRLPRSPHQLRARGCARCRRDTCGGAPWQNAQVGAADAGAAPRCSRTSPGPMSGIGHLLHAQIVRTVIDGGQHGLYGCSLRALPEGPRSDSTGRSSRNDRVPASTPATAQRPPRRRPWACAPLRMQCTKCSISWM